MIILYLQFLDIKNRLAIRFYTLQILLFNEKYIYYLLEKFIDSQFLSPNVQFIQ